MSEQAIRVTITDTTTGESATLDDMGRFDDGVFNDFIWSDGNYSCDCNREIFFSQATGIEGGVRECSTGRYRVKITDEAGNQLYED